jgi:S-adenosylmethionine synthetase
LAHQLARHLDKARPALNYLTPDGKTQVGVEYRDRRPHRIHSLTVVASQAESATLSLADLAQTFDFRPAGIIQRFGLHRLPSEYPEGFFQQLAVYGHVGRPDLDLPWERLDQPL